MVVNINCIKKININDAFLKKIKEIASILKNEKNVLSIGISLLDVEDNYLKDNSIICIECSDYLSFEKEQEVSNYHPEWILSKRVPSSYVVLWTAKGGCVW